MRKAPADDLAGRGGGPSWKLGWGWGRLVLGLLTCEPVKNDMTHGHSHRLQRLKKKWVQPCSPLGKVLIPKGEDLNERVQKGLKAPNMGFRSPPILELFKVRRMRNYIGAAL